MKLYKKCDLKFENNRIIHETEDGIEQIGVPDQVFILLNTMEQRAQMAEYILSQDKPAPIPSYKGFERKHARGMALKLKACTPLLDAKVEEAEDLIEELRQTREAEDVTKQLEYLAPLIRWIADEYIVEGDNYDRFDLPRLGNPLELTNQDIVEVLATELRAQAWCESRDIEHEIVKGD